MIGGPRPRPAVDDGRPYKTRGPDRPGGRSGPPPGRAAGPAGQVV